MKMNTLFRKSTQNLVKAMLLLIKYIAFQIMVVLSSKSMFITKIKQTCAKFPSWRRNEIKCKIDSLFISSHKQSCFLLEKEWSYHNDEQNGFLSQVLISPCGVVELGMKNLVGGPQRLWLHCRESRKHVWRDDCQSSQGSFT